MASENREERLRAIARPIIQRVLLRTLDKSEREIKQALNDAYPHHTYTGLAYYTWKSEINRQIRFTPPKPKTITRNRAQLTLF